MYALAMRHSFLIALRHRESFGRAHKSIVFGVQRKKARNIKKQRFASTACEFLFSLYHFWTSFGLLERTLVLTWQGIARMDAGVDVGSAKWPQNRAQGPPPKKELVFLKSSKTNRKIIKLSLFRAFKTGFRTSFLGLFLSFVSARSFLHFSSTPELILSTVCGTFIFFRENQAL